MPEPTSTTIPLRSDLCDSAIEEAGGRLHRSKQPAD